MLKDNEIIDLYNDRDETAISQTNHKYGRYCCATAHRILSDERDVEECVNEAYLRTWNMIPPCSPPSLRTFLGRVVRTVALDMYEKRLTQKRGGEHMTAILDEASHTVPLRKTVEMMADELALQDTVEHFLMQLPPRRRWIFVQRYWHMRSIADIAGELKQSEGSVKMSLSRTRKKLKVVLEKEGIVF